tara:strand:- start:127 stop:330 length:204 start_codon:yes stop_codon:yes gene_type:complete
MKKRSARLRKRNTKRRHTKKNRYRNKRRSNKVRRGGGNGYSMPYNGNLSVAEMPYSYNRYSTQGNIV